MRSATIWAFAALLVVSWAGISEGAALTEGTGAQSSVKDLAGKFSGDKVEESIPEKKDKSELVTIGGAEVKVQDLVKTFEELKNSPEASGTQFPTVQEFESAVTNGEKIDSDPAICAMITNPGTDCYSVLKSMFCIPE